LLPIAPLLITPGTRPGLFADPVRLTGPASPGDRLVAFLGRQPRPRPRPGPAAPKPGTRRSPVRGDSRESGWSISAGRQTSGAEPTRTWQNRSNRYDNRRQGSAGDRANRGIGQALVEEALARGARRVYAGTRQPLAHPDGRVTPLTLDITDAAQI